jgi:hypothetical protein
MIELGSTAAMMGFMTGATVLLLGTTGVITAAMIVTSVVDAFIDWRYWRNTKR